MARADAADRRAAAVDAIYRGASAPTTSGADFVRNTMGGDYLTPSASTVPDSQQWMQRAQQGLQSGGYYPEALALAKQAQDLAPKFEKVGSGDRMFDPQTRQVVLNALPDLAEVNLGGTTSMIDKRDPANAGRSFQRTMTPGESASNQLGWANYGLGRERLAHDRTQAGRDSLQSVTVDGQPLVFDKRTGRYSQGMDGNGEPVGQAKMRRDAGSVLDLINQATPLIKQSTGSWGGAAVDQGARFFGVATDGAEAIGELRAIEGALLAKMPRMEGPQSNADVALYKQAAGMLADPTVPVSQRMRAVEALRAIQERYAGVQPGASRFEGWRGGNEQAGEIKFLGFE